MRKQNPLQHPVVALFLCCMFLLAASAALTACPLDGNNETAQVQTRAEAPVNDGRLYGQVQSPRQNHQLARHY